MVNVTYELDGAINEEAAARTVEKVVRYHQQVLLGVTCPIHQENPRLKVYGRSLQDLAVSVESCCEVLSEKVASQLDLVSRRDQL
jgi:ribosome maturation factor RimP